jgi:26 proteasome complex subunit DSS1
MASSDSKTQEKAPAAEQAKEEESQKPVTAAALGEDDEFEDFPVDGALASDYDAATPS